MPNGESKLELPDRPAERRDEPVAAWSDPVTIDTYDVADPDIYPAYLDRRVYQGSSGRVYPLPFFERVSDDKVPRTWQALHIENEYVRLVVLPELGGRIHVGFDKTRGYDFFYRNNVIKPALVGVTGPWISGGVEFNWPQHHRPATYLPTDCSIEEEDDGSRTLWCADLDPFARMKGMHGVRLRPHSSLVELRVRLFNRTPDVQTFLWWANVAARVGDSYQSFFPTDVHFVADHAKRAVTSFPASRGRYYGIDYPSRVTPESPDADRIDWYRNIPVPTSYMCLGSDDDFFGGYDHERGAGFVHWADHRISPGKKQWTWGNAPFGWAWDRNLTDTDGPYVELMAGVYTDNQPDFSFLLPGETKTFSQFWYPIQDIGPAHQATRDGAVALHLDGNAAHLRFVPTARVTAALTLEVDKRPVWSETVETAPGEPALRTVTLDATADASTLTLRVAADGAELVTWTPRRDHESVELPPAAFEPAQPEEIASTDELFLVGTHLEQYRHATRSPEPYWLEALRRDPDDMRSNTALGARRYRDGLLNDAEVFLRRAVARSTRYNPNPADGEPHYRLGLVLLAKDDLAGADAAFAKASWNGAWAAASQMALGRIAARRGEWDVALARANDVLDVDTGHLQATALAVIALRKLGREDAATARLDAARSVDRLDWWLRSLVGLVVDTPAATLIDVALEYDDCGCPAEALATLEAAEQRELRAPVVGIGNQLPLIALHRADLLARTDRLDEARSDLRAVEELDRATCFPGRLADALMLQRLRSFDPENRTVNALLGHWLYAHGRVADAVAAWVVAGDDPVCLRNRGVAAFNHSRDAAEAVRCYERAIQLAPRDARLWYERDQLAKRVGENPAARLGRLEQHLDLVSTRDDLCVEYVNLLLLAGRPHEALDLLNGRTFHPWEGGEGRTLGAWQDTHAAIAREHLAAGDADGAVAAAEAALRPIPSLGEDLHPLANTAHLDLLLGDALQAAGRLDEARVAWERAATAQGDFVAMATTAYSPRSAASIKALSKLGRTDEADRAARRLLEWATAQRDKPATIDYFATSLPTMLLFHEDLQVRHELTCDTIRAQASLALGEDDAASALLDAVLAVDPSEHVAREARHPSIPDHPPTDDQKEDT